MGNEVRTVRFPHKMHRRSVSICNQYDIQSSGQVLPCSLTEWVIGDIWGKKFLIWIYPIIHAFRDFLRTCFEIIFVSELLILSH